MDLLPLYRIPILSGLEYDDESEVEAKDFVQLGADHGLMYKSAVVVEVLEVLRGFWD